jgi:hypothetical protein
VGKQLANAAAEKPPVAAAAISCSATIWMRESDNQGENW